ncbi:MAG: dimethyl sulfoxide reductase anchor subunit [Acidimicrobiales bacterium]
MSSVAVALGVKPALLPLDAGEQYRFAFDMGACVGCHSCEVACAEQNGNPVDVNWRKVGEVEAGAFPAVARFSMSMSCNQCLEPTCLSGCPTNAYVKLDNGVVSHLADSCIGCQYCIWNCPYEAPVFNPERRIVTKCDMCLPRLEAGQLPACVGACPTQALTVEKVDIAAWRTDHSAADAPGLPPASITVPTTRIILPEGLPSDAAPARIWAIEPEHPHWPLIALTLLTQLAVGTVTATVASRSGRGAPVAAAAGAIALVASVGHLGRPAHAWKALRNLRRSWLSREVALFGAFAGAAVVFATPVWSHDLRILLGVAAVVLGLVGVYASARLYLVPARPAWNTPRTVVAFFATALTTGPLVVVLAGERPVPGVATVRVELALAALGTVVQLAIYQSIAASVAVRRGHEWVAFGRLLFRRFRGLLFIRAVLGLTAVALCVAAGVSPVGRALPILAALALGCVAVGELIGRYLFYVTVVPMTSDGSFFRGLR